MSATRALLDALAADPSPAAAQRVIDPEVVAAADRLGILPVLAGVAVRLGRIPDVAGSVATVLGERRHRLSATAVLLAARDEGRRRHHDLADLERRTLKLLGAYRAVPLKGAGLHRYPIWPDPAERPQRDVDLWCPESSVAAAAEYTLRRNGYRLAPERPTRQVWTDDHHDDPLVLSGLSGSVELHRHPTIHRARSAVVYRLQQTPEGVELTAESLVLHIIVHAQLQDFAFVLRRLPLVPLLDVAYAIERGLVTAQVLRAGAATPAAARAVDFHLYCADRLRGRRPYAALGLRWRWWCAVFFLTAPRIATLQQELVLARHALSREMMQRRAGRPLRFTALLRHRFWFVVDRGARAARRVASQR